MVVDCRQEKLEQLAARFDRKAGMRETWLSENQRLVSQVHSHESLTLFRAGSVKQLSICLLVCLSLTTAATACGGFATERHTGTRY